MTAPRPATVVPRTATAAQPTASADGELGCESRCLEDLHLGDVWRSEWREISGEDVGSFAELTGDDDPLHATSDAPGSTSGAPGSRSLRSPFGEPVAHGLLGLGVMAGLSASSPRTSTLALVEIREWAFEHPIFFGNRVQVVTEIEAIESHGRRAGRVTWYRQLFNQDGRVVQRGRIVTLVARRDSLRHSRSGRPVE